jgi:hypothetical protein
MRLNLLSASAPLDWFTFHGQFYEEKRLQAWYPRLVIMLFSNTILVDCLHQLCYVLRRIWKECPSFFTPQLEMSNKLVYAKWRLNHESAWLTSARRTKSKFRNYATIKKVTSSVVQWSEFLTTDPEVRVHARHSQILEEVVLLERGSLSRVSTIEDVLWKKKERLRSMKLRIWS